MIAAGGCVIPVRRQSQVFRLYTIGDCHIGNRGCSMERLREDIEAVRADPDARAILMGDLADYIGPTDRRWDAASIPTDYRVKDLADWGAFLMKLVVKEFSPIKGKIIGALSGNHEATFQAQQAAQLHAATCNALGVPDLGYCCFLDLIFRKALRLPINEKSHGRRYRIYAHHGAGAAQSPGGKTNRLVGFMMLAEADIYLIGHVHEKDVKRIDTLAANDSCTAITTGRKRLGVFTGSYLRTYSEGAAGYAERAGYKPVPLGCSVVEFHPFGHDWKHRPESVSARVAI